MAILEFKQDLDYYFHTACEFNDNDEYVKCLDYLHQALDIAQSEYDKDACDETIDNLYSVMSEIAATYNEMGLYSESISKYYKMFDCPDEFKEELYFGLVKNYAMLEMVEQAAYYLNEGIEEGYLDPGDGISKADIMDGMGSVDNEPFALVTDDDNDYVINLARRLLEANNDTKYAKQILQDVPPDSKSYIYALELLSIINLSENHPKKALEYAEKAIAIKPGDVDALCVKIMALSYSHKSEKLDSAIQQLEKTEITTLEDATRAASAMATINNARLALKYSEICLGYTPYDKQMGLTHALAQGNLGNKTACKEEFVQLQIIYPSNIEIKYLARRFDSDPDAKFDLLGFRDADDDMICDEVDEFWKNATTIAKAKSEIKKHPEILEKFEYVLQSGRYELIKEMGTMMLQTDTLEHYVREKLIEPDFSLVCKKSFLNSLLMFCVNKKFNLVANNVYREFSPKLPECMTSPNAYDAYWMVYSALAFVESNFDKKLNTACKNLSKTYIEFDNTLAPVIAAYIAYKSKLSVIFSQKEYCAEIFGCGVSDIDMLIYMIKNSKRT